ncbi:helix-turn-helix domain-containing protein [Nocardia sp. NPDC057440]|uniref:helix-turn-helix domain-containing protein n=1 Tax=Nocardia sp. NPDC057440 TaxID=3346134 RepID=UPI00366EF062
MYLHRNTVRHRLVRISGLTGPDLDSTDDSIVTCGSSTAPDPNARGLMCASAAGAAQSRSRLAAGMTRTACGGRQSCRRRRHLTHHRHRHSPLHRNHPRRCSRRLHHHCNRHR